MNLFNVKVGALGVPIKAIGASIPGEWTGAVPEITAFKPPVMVG
jgi:hypothetical protein